MDDSVPARDVHPASDALETAADERLARRALRTLAEEGAEPRATMADVLADLADRFSAPRPAPTARPRPPCSPSAPG